MKWTVTHRGVMIITITVIGESCLPPRAANETWEYEYTFNFHSNKKNQREKKKKNPQKKTSVLWEPWAKTTDCYFLWNNPNITAVSVCSLSTCWFVLVENGARAFTPLNYQVTWLVDDMHTDNSDIHTSFLAGCCSPVTVFRHFHTYSLIALVWINWWISKAFPMVWFIFTKAKWSPFKPICR